MYAGRCVDDRKSSSKWKKRDLREGMETSQPIYFKQARSPARQRKVVPLLGADQRRVFQQFIKLVVKVGRVEVVVLDEDEQTVERQKTRDAANVVRVGEKIRQQQRIDQMRHNLIGKLDQNLLVRVLRKRVAEQGDPRQTEGVLVLLDALQPLGLVLFAVLTRCLVGRALRSCDGLLDFFVLIIRVAVVIADKLVVRQRLLAGDQERRDVVLALRHVDHAQQLECIRNERVVVLVFLFVLTLSLFKQLRHVLELRQNGISKPSAPIVIERSAEVTYHVVLHVHVGRDVFALEDTGHLALDLAHSHLRWSNTSQSSFHDKSEWIGVPTAG